MSKQHTKVIDANFIIQNGNVLSNDKELFFGNEDVVETQEECILTLLVLSGICKSKGQARKTAFIQLLNDKCQWDEKVAAKDFELPSGFIEIQTGKLKHNITVLKPR